MPATQTRPPGRPDAQRAGQAHHDKAVTEHRLALAAVSVCRRGGEQHVPAVPARRGGGAPGLHVQEVAGEQLDREAADLRRCGGRCAAIDKAFDRVPRRRSPNPPQPVAGRPRAKEILLAVALFDGGDILIPVGEPRCIRYPASGPSATSSNSTERVADVTAVLERRASRSGSGAAGAVLGRRQLRPVRRRWHAPDHPSQRGRRHWPRNRIPGTAGAEHPRPVLRVGRDFPFVEPTHTLSWREQPDWSGAGGHAAGTKGDQFDDLVDRSLEGA